MALIEILATIFGFICVWLTIKQNIWCWPAGLIQVSLYVFVFHQARLYSDMGLHVIYVLMQFFGWYYWMYGGADRGQAKVARLSPRARAAWATMALAGTACLGFVMDNYTNADLAYWDAATTVLSLIAQWLMAKKILESFLIWMAVDVLCVGIYAVKALYPTTGLYLAFLVMATMGYLEWRKSWLQQA
jgi:nicotinamide mononucleotide transporter